MTDNNDNTPGEKKVADEAALAETAKPESPPAPPEENKLEAEKVKADAQKPAAQAGSAAPQQAAVAPAPPRKGTSVIGWLAFLLVLALGAAAGWSVQQGLGREAELKSRITELEGRAGTEKSDLAEIQKKIQRDLQKGLRGVSDDAARQTQLLESLQSQLRDQQEKMRGQQEKLASYSANDHQSWLRAEAQYLLRLANQRLIMAQDVVSAQALLSSADSILQEMDDAGLYAVRAAVAAEQAALRAVPKIDVEGIYLRLSALVEQADGLVIFQLPEQEMQPEREESDDWQLRLERGYEEATKKLSDYIVIRRRDVPMHALMDPQWEGLVRQNLRMLLEQAQVALLSGNQTLYQESLQRSQHWVSQFFESDESASRAMAREIDQLSGLTITVAMPDLTRSLRTLDEAMKARLEQGGAQ